MTTRRRLTSSATAVRTPNRGAGGCEGSVTSDSWSSSLTAHNQRGWGCPGVPHRDGTCCVAPVTCVDPTLRHPRNEMDIDYFPLRGLSGAVTDMEERVKVVLACRDTAEVGVCWQTFVHAIPGSTLGRPFKRCGTEIVCRG